MIQINDYFQHFMLMSIERNNTGFWEILFWVYETIELLSGYQKLRFERHIEVNPTGDNSLRLFECGNNRRDSTVQIVASE